MYRWAPARRCLASCVATVMVATFATVFAASASSAAAAAPGVSAHSITVGGVEVVNATGFSFAPSCTGAEIAFKKVNAQGGVNGRKINYVGCMDDGGVPAQDSSLTAKLIQQDQVFAIVPASVAFTGFQLAVQNNTPYFGWGISPIFCNNSQGFGFNGCTGPTTSAWVERSWASVIKSVAPNLTTFGVINTNNPQGMVNGTAISKGAVADGLRQVYNNGSVPQTGTSDWTPYIQGIVQANPSVVFSALPNDVQLWGGLKAAGFQGVMVDANSYDEALLSNKASATALEGAYTYTTEVPFQDTSNKAVKTLLSDIKKYGPSGTQPSQDLAQGYYSAEMFLDMVKKAGRNLSYTSFYKVANQKHYCFNGNGGIAQVCYPTGHTDSVPCLGLVQIQNGKFVSKQAMFCAPPATGSDANK
jgi:branched-chain amino acid transport system substrate-binding protein